MDTLQLNKINELAREYLRLGIAKGSSDAVEKARFQLAFEAQRSEPEPSPYETLFNERMERKAAEQREANVQQAEKKAELSPLDIRKDRFEEFSARLNALEGNHERTLRTQQSRIAQLEQTIESMRTQITSLSAQRSAPAQTPQREPVEAPIASTIEQTIKGRTITSDDVAVDKIFYFGNR